MIELGIIEGDQVIVKKSPVVKDGDVVLACVDGEYTLKTFRRKGREVYLEPANSNYSIIRAENELTIFGIVTGVVRHL